MAHDDDDNGGDDDDDDDHDDDDDDGDDDDDDDDDDLIMPLFLLSKLMKNFELKPHFFRSLHASGCQDCMHVISQPRFLLLVFHSPPFVSFIPD